MTATVTSARSRLLYLAVLFILAPLAASTPARADSSSEYHEAGRFGGFDEVAVPGRFVEPTGFSVDAQEGNAVYVADRTSSVEGVAGKTKGEFRASWRIQKLSGEGRVLGTTTFTLPGGGKPSAIAGLAVDHRAGRLYALVMAPAKFGKYEHATQAQELLAWSIQPQACQTGCAHNGKGETVGEELVAAPGLKSDELGSTGGLLSDEEQLDSNGAPLYEPQGIAVDPLEEPNVDDPVVIEASDLLSASIETSGADDLFHGPGGQGFNRNNATEFEQYGDTIVQQVATQTGSAQANGTCWAGAKSIVSGEVGRLLSCWSAAASTEEALGRPALRGGGGPLGIFDDAEKDPQGRGYLSVLIHGDDVYSETTNAYVVRLDAALDEAHVLNKDANDPGEENEREAIMGLDPGPFFTDPETQNSPLPFELKNAGPEVAQLSKSSEGGPALYAADVRFEVLENEISQTGEESGITPYWRSYDEPRLREFAVGKAVNVGVRLLKAKSTGLISGKGGETIVNTLGDKPKPAPCNIDAEEGALAAGSEGTLWILDRGPVGSAINTLPEGVGVGREVIELAPGKGSSKSECPQPSGTFKMGLCGAATQSGEAPLTVPAGVAVSFDASSVSRRGGTPFAYEWAFGDGSQSPPPEILAANNQKTIGKPTHTFTTPGEYKVTLRLHSEYGLYERSATVKVSSEGGGSPQAEFAVQGGEAPQLFTFNAATSTAGTCNTIEDYRWNWGDGSPPEDQPGEPVARHTFEKPGTYGVTLTVLWPIGKGQYEHVYSQQSVTVKAPELPPSETEPSSLTSANPLLTNPPPGSGHPASVERGPTYVSPHASFSGGALSVKISCPPAKVSCAGTVRAETAAAFPSGISAKNTAGKRKLKPTTARLLIAQASFRLAAGHSRTVTLHLTATGASLLKRLRRLPVLVLVAAHDPLGDLGSASLHLTLVSASTARRSG